MPTITFANARILTMAGPRGARRGDALGELGLIERGYVVIEEGRITAVGSGDAPSVSEDDDAHVVDADGSVLMPAFVDCHTHICWSGSRLDEFEAICKGVDYLTILERGGGIMSTVEAVREASEEELAVGIMQRIASMTALGTGTIEIKSGYGLDTDTELKMLRAIHTVSRYAPHYIVGTFLGAHAIDPANPRFVEQTINETLPAVAQEFPGIVCDAYCEQGAWSLEETRRLFEVATDLGCPLRVHADQFNSLGGVRLAVEMGAVSVDHLEATTSADLELLASSSTFGVVLPSSAFHLDDRYADARRFVDAGGALAIASNYNPGSAPSPSMPFTLALACRKLGLTPDEAIGAATWNAAVVLGLQDEIGSIEVGKRADLQILDTADERELAFEYASAGPLLVVIDGQVVHSRLVENDDEWEMEMEEDEEEDDDEGEDEGEDEEEFEGAD